jgi:hypothetical protein
MAIGTTAAGVLAVVTLIQGGDASSPPVSPAPTTSVTPDAPDATIAGHPVYLSPDLNDERILPQYQGLPSAVDLSSAASANQLDRARYAFAWPGSGVPLVVALVDDAGDTYALQVPPQYGLPLDVNGNSPFTHTSLSPSGELLALVTKNGFAVYDVRTHSWSEKPASGSWRERLGYVWNGGSTPQPAQRAETSGFPLADAWGPTRTSPDGADRATAWFSTHITEVQAGYDNPEVVAVSGHAPALLVINGRNRFKGCCAVAGWLDQDWVVYESRAAGVMRLLAWNIRDGQFMRVASVTGLPEGGVTGSYADLTRAD